MTFDEVQHVHHRHNRFLRSEHNDDLVLTETCTAEVSSDRSSSRRRQAFSAPRKRSAGTPPSTFLFLPIHLSNSPEIMEIPLPGDPGSRRSPRLPNQIGCLVTLSVRSFAGAPSRRRRAARRCGAYIVAWSQPCQLSIWQISPHSRAVDFTLCHRHIGVPNRRAAPHSRHIPPAFFAPG